MRLVPPSSPPGTSVSEYLRALVKSNPSILALSFATYTQPPPAEARCEFSDIDFRHLDVALARREREGMPFWDAVMLTCFQRNEIANGLLRAALFHHPMQGNWFTLPRATIIDRGVSDLQSANDTVIAIGSSITVDGCADSHLPLLDFHCKETTENDRLVEAACRLLLESPTAICRSGESYHAYGLSVVTREELCQILYRAILLAPIVDRVYVAHQLIEGRCALRINTTLSKPTLPELKFVVSPD